MFRSSARTVLVLDRVGDLAVKLNHIGLTNEAQSVRPEYKPAFNSDASFDGYPRNVDTLVDGATSERVQVLIEGLLKVDQRTLPWAV
ncbi:hypothetical protein caldi_03930 [Caldinitratiruptor microaerophilus]|uniref:Uncharacterized protein n=1 Tax=Caldinitratiruptor microaerophilus TaxID=671077 RepID=A0AA35CJ45_9FIRM|nr:hypothetical protein caldi_03930 [Caldinitratiruptor microaerophilus]